MGLAYSPKIVTDNMMFCLDAGNSKSYPGSGTTWTDLVAQGANATLINGVGYDIENGGALTFDGTNDYCSITTPLTIENDFTFAAWAKREGNSATSIGGIFGNHWHSENAGVSIHFRNADGYVRIATGNGASRPTFDVTFSRSNSLWNHYVMRYSGSTSDVYINGVLLDSRSVTPVIQTSSTKTFAIGRWAPSYGSYYLNGKISNCAAYNRALLPDEIQQIFNAHRGRFGI
jgi:hypothetical protein